MSHFATIAAVKAADARGTSGAAPDRDDQLSAQENLHDAHKFLLPIIMWVAWLDFDSHAASW